MAYKIDVLISYSEADNQPTENSSGWVSDFKYFLELMLEQVLGEKPNILMKEDGDTLTGANLEDVATLIPILSSNYIQSGQCLDLLEDFGKITESKEVNRIFKVLKSPVSLSEQPARIRDLIGLEMFKVDNASGNITEYEEYFDSESSDTYWMHIVDVAFDINEAIFQLTGKSGSAKQVINRKVVYLADSAQDLVIQRNIIKRELQRHGFKVLPDRTLPSSKPELDQVVNGLISRSDLSIHLIGTSYGDIPEGTEKSVVDIQNGIAAEKVKDVGRFNFPRLIWINPAQKMSSEKQKGFIENIKRDADASQGAEIYQTPLEDFKNIVREEIIEGRLDEKRRESEKFSDDLKKSVYLIHDKIDSDRVNSLKTELENSGLEVLLPEFSGELLTVRENHINNLRKFDGAIIYHGDVNKQWVKMKILDLLKAPGFGRTKPMKSRMLVSNSTDGFEIFQDQGIQITGEDSSLKSELNNFINDLKN